MRLIPVSYTHLDVYKRQHTEELKQYVKNETIEELETDINDKFSAINTKFLFRYYRTIKRYRDDFVTVSDCLLLPV